MRKIQIGDNPRGFYVYLWRHGEIDRYVGKGTNGRWRGHLNTRANDGNQLKMRYFRKYGRAMTCFIIAEDLTESAAGDLEKAEVSKRGVYQRYANFPGVPRAARRAGPLLNDRDGSVINGSRRKRGERAPHEVSNHYRLFQAQPDFALDATFRLLSTENPWRKNCPPRRLYSLVLSKEPKTVREVIEGAAQLGIEPRETQRHLRWLYTWIEKGPQCEIGGKLYEGGLTR